MCDGVNALKNPMFNYAIIPNKGELLKVSSNILPPDNKLWDILTTRK